MDWKAAFEEILSERREQLGERPTSDEWIALRAGELSDEDRERLLEYASVDPEAGRELFDVLRFPGAVDDGVVEDGVDERWRALRERLVEEGEMADVLPIQAPASAPEPRRYGWLPLAAMFFLGVGVTLVFGPVFGPGPDPRVNLEIVELLPVTEGPRTRGVEKVTMDEGTGGLVLTLAVSGMSTSGMSTPTDSRASFGLEITRADGGTTALDGLGPGLGGVFVLEVPGEDWAEGLHELRLKDVDGTLVARFQLDVERRR